VREGGAPKSQGVSGECVCDSARALAISRRVFCSCVYLMSSRTVPPCSFYSLKEVQGYEILVRGVNLVGKGAQRPKEGLIRW
jgi:hypothetical protein